MLRPLAAPAAVFRLTGLMPYFPAPAPPRIVQPFAETPLFTGPPPASPGDGLWAASRSRRVPKAHVACVKDGIVLPTGAVFDDRGRFIETASHDFDFLDDPGRKRRSFVLKPHGLLPGILRFGHDVVALAASNQAFYFHWIFDVLPRFGLAEQAGFEHGPFLVEAELPFQQQTLRMLGVTGARRIDPRETGAISASNLIVPCHSIAPGHVFPDWAIRFLRERFLPAASEGRGPSARRLYVSRERAGHRRVVNEPEIVSYLAGHGFEAIRVEELAFREQVSLFRDAEIVIAPHGGGLANLVFCTRGAKVIELFPSVNIDLYYRLASRLGIDYLFVKSDNPLGAFMGPADYHIDLAELKTALAAALSGESLRPGL
jgi:capsular polysaccharide biosynthesis protein